MNTADWTVVGGGIVGLAIANELARRFPTDRVVLLEKEEDVGRHASGRNSGVLHAGFYYTADSLKARFTREGNARMREHCARHDLALNPCGKLVVARDERDLDGLEELARRASANGVDVRPVSAEEARRLEPRARTHRSALWSPSTCTVDPKQVTQSFATEANRLGVEVRTGTAFLGCNGRTVTTARGPLETGYVVNAAGLYADRVARAYGFGRRYRILPFKGLYLVSSEPPGAFRTCIYPVPDLANPFLGVHFTVTVDGRAKIGPTAVPCLWREHYGGWHGFRAADLAEVTGTEAALFLRSGFGFGRLALREARKMRRTHLVGLAARLAEGVRPADYHAWGRPGIRAQLLDVTSRSLAMDFVLEGDAGSMHVLNAVSPAFTCSLPFADHMCDAIERARNGAALEPPT